MKRALLVLLCVPSLASADELKSTRNQELVEVSHTVEISVADGVATYKVRRQFANGGKVADEAGLAIDLPSGAAATGLRIRAKDRWYDGELMEREKAAALYHELTGLGAYAPKDPALLQWLWADKLYLQVFPVMPGAVSTVEYTLTVPTRYAHGRYWLSYPRTAASRGLVTPTITVKPAWGDATTAITIDGHRAAPDTAVVLVPPVHEAWETAVGAQPGASYVASAAVVPENSHTQKPIATAKIDYAITHTYRGDLRVELVTPQGKTIVLHDRKGGGDNNLAEARELTLPAGTTGAGTWRLVASDHAALDTGTIDRWKLTFGSGADATTVAPTDLPVFIPDAPESASDAGVAPITVAPPAIDKWTGRLGRIVASPAHAFARFEVDVAPELSKVPHKAQIVFVVDASYSGGDDLMAAQLATMRAYLAHVPDAEVEVVAYRRFATRVFNAFVPAADFDRRVREAIAAKAFALGNGSALDEAGRVATAALATRTGERRVVMFTDELVRPALTPALAANGLAGLAPQTVVHVVVPSIDHDDRIRLYRDDARGFYKLASPHHGILATIGGFPLKKDKDLPPAVLELVRPTRIEHLALAAVGGTVDSGQTTLDEGDGLRLWSTGKAVPTRVTMSGHLWSDPIRRDVDVTADFSRATAAFVFGADEHQGLSNDEMMKVALAGRAVSPVTSYVAFEPGTRPSTLGLDRTIGAGRYGSLGHGSGSGSGYGTGRAKPDPASLVDTRACVAAHKPPAGWTVDVTIETTLDEIVDVALRSAASPFATCVVEAVWAARLDSNYNQQHESFAFTLR